MLKLTTKRVDESTPSKTPYVIWDNEIKGFGCRIYPKGTKTYMFYYRSPVSRVPACFKIGVHGDFTADIAREKAVKLKSQVSQKIDPRIVNQEKKLLLKRAIPFENYLQIFIDQYMKENNKPSTFKKSMWNIRKHILPFFGQKPLCSITRKDVFAFKDSMIAKGSCTKCLRLLSAAFNYAELIDYRAPNSNPCKGIPKYPEKKIERFLSQEELARLEKTLTEREVLGKDSPYAFDAIRLIIYTGCRLNEVLSLKWEDVDFNACCLRLKDSKTGKRTIPLNEAALKVLSNVTKQGDNPYVFCGRRLNGAPSHLVQIQKFWGRIRTQADIGDVRIHDLRHSFASFMIKNNLSIYEVSKLLGHRNITTTMRYAHLSDQELVKVTKKGGIVFDEHNKYT